MLQTQAGKSLLLAVCGLAPEIMLVRDEIDRSRRLPSSLVEKLRAARIFELWLPQAFGGPELHPVEFVRVIEALASADGSVGWCATNAGVFSLLAGSLCERAARQIFGDHAIIAGSVNPSGKAVALDGGFRVTGHWAYGTGIDYSTWVVGNCVIHDGATPRRTTLDKPDLRFLFFPKIAVEVIDTWHASGMRGTGSHDFRVSDLFVPEEHSTPAFTSLAVQPGTLFQVPPLSLFTIALAAVSMGIARAAIDALVELAGAKTPMGSTALLRDKPSVQSNVARAEALVRAARVAVFDAISEQWDEVAAGKQPSMQARTSIKLSCTYCAEACANAVDLVYSAAGGSALYESGRIARCFRDAHAATQHIGLSVNKYELAGRVLLGLDLGTWRF